MFSPINLCKVFYTTKNVKIIFLYPCLLSGKGTVEGRNREKNLKKNCLDPFDILNLYISKDPAAKL